MNDKSKNAAVITDPQVKSITEKNLILDNPITYTC